MSTTEEIDMAGRHRKPTPFWTYVPGMTKPIRRPAPTSAALVQVTVPLVRAGSAK